MRFSFAAIFSAPVLVLLMQQVTAWIPTTVEEADKQGGDGSTGGVMKRATSTGRYSNVTVEITPHLNSTSSSLAKEHETDATAVVADALYDFAEITALDVYCSPKDDVLGLGSDVVVLEDGATSLFNMKFNDTCTIFETLLNVFTEKGGAASIYVAEQIVDAMISTQTSEVCIEIGLTGSAGNITGALYGTVAFSTASRYTLNTAAIEADLSGCKFSN